MSVSVNVTTRVDQAAISGWIDQHLGRAVARASGRARDLAKAEISKAGRVDLGQMRQGVVSETVRRDGNTIVGRIVATAAHSRFQHEGTPQTIYPRRARVLRFRPKGSRAFVFAPEVRGIHPANPTKPLPFLTIALDRLSTSDFT